VDLDVLPREAPGLEGKPGPLGEDRPAEDGGEEAGRKGPFDADPDARCGVNYQQAEDGKETADPDIGLPDRFQEHLRTLRDFTKKPK
jgi:hypothetical protein